MKKEIIKVWGICLTIVVAASLLFSAAPVQAGELDWGTYSPFPSKTGNVLTANLSIADLAVANDGIMYLATGNSSFIYKSTNAGKTWSKLSNNFTGNVTFVAVSPEDSDYVVVGYGEFFYSVVSTNVSVSTNGGSSWGDLGKPSTAAEYVTEIYDLQISNPDGATYYVGVAGRDSAGEADVWWFDVGAAAPKWNSTKGAAGFQDVTMVAALALAFSPNVASDKVMVAVTSNTTNVWFQIYSLSTKKWNTDAGFADYPPQIEHESGDPIDGADFACISLSPDYLGSDDSLRIGFVGIGTITTTEAGIYRMKDTSDKMLTDDKQVWSLAFDGTNLVAGAYDSTKVWYSDNPLASEPDFSTASTYKRPAGVDKVVVGWKGSDVVAGASGNSTAFSISRDNGKSFNGMSFIDTEAGNLGTMLDVEVSADGKTIAMLCNTGKALTLWRYVGAWETVFSYRGTGWTDNYILRIAPDDPDAIYLSMAGSSTSTTIYYTQDGGKTKWFVRSARYPIQDLAVESSSVAYAARYDTNTVSKTTNSGFTWATAKDTGITGNIYMLRSLGKDKVIAGSDSGYVGWTADGNTSWDGIATKLYGSGNVQVTASTLATNDYVYATIDGDDAANRIERWQIGVSTSWKNLEAPVTGCNSTGIALAEGVLYVQSVTINSTDNFTTTWRSISPTTAEPGSGDWATMVENNVVMSATPQALKVSKSPVILWSVDTWAPKLFVYTDTLNVAGPTLVSPADGATVAVNIVSGGTYAVPLTWKRISKAKVYDVRIAYDSGFTQVVDTITTDSTTDDPVTVVVGELPTFTQLDPGIKYYWRVRVNIAGPIKSPWSETRSFTIGTLPTPAPPVTISPAPAPVIAVPPAPAITLQPAPIVLPTPAPAQTITIPPAPAPPAPITPVYIWAIIIIGAILVIAVIILIVRTRRPV